MPRSVLKDLAKEEKLGHDRKRERDRKHKWALGEGPVTRGQQNRRPAKAVSDVYKKHEVEFQRAKVVHGLHMNRKRDPVFETDNSNTDSSTDEEAKEASAAIEPDAGYTYSFDAPHGPSQGGDILGLALAKAVEHFETKATEKLVRDEYEIIAADAEHEAHPGYVADEDDYELI